MSARQLHYLPKPRTAVVIPRPQRDQDIGAILHVIGGPPTNARSGVRRILKADSMLPEPVKPPAPKMPDKATLMERRVSELEATVQELKTQMSALLSEALEIGLSIPVQAPIQH